LAQLAQLVLLVSAQVAEFGILRKQLLISVDMKHCSQIRPIRRRKMI
jgi:hypothetical protein